MLALLLDLGVLGIRLDLGRRLGNATGAGSGRNVGSLDVFFDVGFRRAHIRLADAVGRLDLRFDAVGRLDLRFDAVGRPMVLDMREVTHGCVCMFGLGVPSGYGGTSTSNALLVKELPGGPAAVLWSLGGIQTIAVMFDTVVVVVVIVVVIVVVVVVVVRRVEFILDKLEAKVEEGASTVGIKLGICGA